MSTNQKTLQSKETLEATILVKSVDADSDTYQEKLPWSPFKIVLFILFEFAIMLYMGYNFIFLIPVHVKQMVQNGDKTILMALLSCSSSLVSVLSGIITGYVSDRIRTRLGRRAPFILPSVFIMVATLIIRTVIPIKNASPGIIALYILLYVIGSCGKEAAITAYKSLIPDLVHQSQIGLVSGLFGFSALSALIFGLGLFGVLVSYIPEIVISSVVCTVLILTCSIAILFFQEPKHHYSSGFIEFTKTKSENLLIVKNASIQSDDNIATEKDYLLSHKKNIENKETVSSFSYKELITNTRYNPFANWNFTWVFASRVFYYLSLALLMTYTFFFFADAFGHRFPILLWDDLVTNSVQANSIYLMCLLITSLFSTVLSGALSDTMGRKLFVYLGTFMVAVGMAGTMLTREYSLVLILAIITGIGVGSYHAVETGLVTDVLNKEYAARDLAVWNLSVSVPQLISVPVAGMIIGICDKLFANHKISTPHLGYSIMFLSGAFLQLLSALCISLVRINKARKPSNKNRMQFSKTLDEPFSEA